MIVENYKREDYAPIGARAGAFIVDFIILAVTVYLLKIFTGRYFGLIAPLAGILYEAGMHHTRGATTGQLINGLRVVSMTQRKLGLWQCLVRNIAKGFSVLPLGLGLFIGARRNEQRQAWHDQLAGTYVIQKEAVPIGTRDTAREHVVLTAPFLMLFLGFMLVVVGVIYYAFNYARHSDAYRTAENYIVTSPVVRERVGDPIKPILKAFATQGVGARQFSRFLFQIDGNGHSVELLAILQKDGYSWRLVFAHYRDSLGSETDILGKIRARSVPVSCIADSLLAQGNLALALNMVDSALIIDSTNPEAIGMRGQIRWYRGDLNNGLYDMTHALMANPKLDKVRLSRGLAYLDAGNYNYALGDMITLIDAGNLWPLAYKGKAVALDSLGRSKDAIEAYSEYVAHEIDTSQYEKGRALFRVKALEQKLSADSTIGK